MPRFSLVYPTRHRPQFVRQALRVLAHQGYEDFEVVVSDNFVDPSLSCETICQESELANIRYVRPPKPLGMVANWNHALSHASGEYVCFFTDKMYLLPGSLVRIDRAARHSGTPDIISWVSDTYTADSFDDYFGAGHYFGMPSDVRSGTFGHFDPRGELDRKGRGGVPRSMQSPSHYARGKICFGAFHKSLVNSILGKYGALFQGINPDYTSMIAGLTEARSCIEVSRPCVLSVGTNISNGQLADTRDECALAFIKSLDHADEKLENMMVPGLYAAISNLVAHDYLMMKEQFGLDFVFEHSNWVAYCLLEIERTGRVWSSPEVEQEQRGILAAYLKARGPSFERAVRHKAALTLSSTEPMAGPRYVFRAQAISVAIARRSSRFLKMRLIGRDVAYWFESELLGSRVIQRTVMDNEWPGKRWVRNAYRRFKAWMQ